MRRRQILAQHYPSVVNWAEMKTPADFEKAREVVEIERLPELTVPCPYCDRKFQHQGAVNLHARKCKLRVDDGRHVA